MKRPRNGKYLATLEARLAKMESLLDSSQRSELQRHTEPEMDDIVAQTGGLNMCTATNASFADAHTPSSVGSANQADNQHFPAKECAIRLVSGYFKTFNHIMPLYHEPIFMRRMAQQYPPNREQDLSWWAALDTVLALAHRLRAMSDQSQASQENLKACHFLGDSLAIAQKLTYDKPSLLSAQVLLSTAALLQGTALPDMASMLVASAIRMLQLLDVHRLNAGTADVFATDEDYLERQRTFWVAYIFDRELCMRLRRPLVMIDADVAVMPPIAREPDSLGIVRSSDGYSDVNLFQYRHALASLQSRVWCHVRNLPNFQDKTKFDATVLELNMALDAWKHSPPFTFTPNDLVGRWPKSAILHIVILHFVYFHTLVELNKELPGAENDYSPLVGNCPISKSLPSYPHSIAPVAVVAARAALELAKLTPRGNFACVWLYLDFSICAVLTLFVNMIIRPSEEHVADDLSLVDSWLRVVDVLANSSERPDLLEKRKFLEHMRLWAVKVMREDITQRQQAELGLEKERLQSEWSSARSQRAPLDQLNGQSLANADFFGTDVDPSMTDWQRIEDFGSAELETFLPEVLYADQQHR